MSLEWQGTSLQGLEELETSHGQSSSPTTGEDRQRYDLAAEAEYLVSSGKVQVLLFFKAYL